MGKQVGERAVVLGGSMAGLLAARVLSESYADVVIVDRDELHGVRTARRGVPQGRHVHGLLARGQQILDELFDGFTEAAVEAGVPTGDLGELRWYFNGRRLSPAHTGLVCVSAARPVLEGLVRDRVEAIGNVRLLDGHTVLGPILSEDRSRVEGVEIRDGASGTDQRLVADLVVDATGRGSRTPAWLTELGYAAPEEDRVRIDLTYTTRVYRLPDGGPLGDDLSINPVSTPSHPRGAFLSRIEGGKFMVSLTGVLGDSAPTDEAGFMAFAKSLEVPDVYDVMKDAEPLGDAVAFRYPASVRRHYERLTGFPDGLLVVGDAVCSFNPVYGQGMTVAALTALTLRNHLREGKAPEALAFFKDISAEIDVPWQISASGDLSFPGVEGKRPAQVRIANAYMGRVQRAATRDGRVTGTFMRVAGLVEPATTLMKPAMMLRVLRQSRRVPAPVPAPISVATDEKSGRRAA
ncbi:FAD-dependent oxidoreductase [Amycolatopsis roodepoortensis]|uniref:2-polyprenyl-6-methoxyphenol hydroxylase-like FAD-dependent oxidoreductase n=1 Tax=Amycolatopsis roodepoortensis TaxID=700274 RepID=A0ABR9L7N9_9PSEU|nr:FAD-dependent oxidoreductase [Amycolatopsis roodepoortensis]MBE1576310.1 2-polyprenyl-6-methoxyphenol hydroxylase-like FAD-dependent oxidoreductase [Amycolatopsis roodepoortensis]